MGIDACMHVDLRRPVNEDQVLRWSWELCQSLHTTLRAGYPFAGGDRYGIHPLRLDPTRKRVYVNLSGRYYSPSYPRGNGAMYVTIADWLERRTGGRVFYYGDHEDAWSEDPTMQPFDRVARDEISQALATYWKVFRDDGRPLPAPLCIPCRQPMLVRCSHANGSTDYGCPVCEEAVREDQDGRRTAIPSEARQLGARPECCKAARVLADLLIETERLAATSEFGPFNFCPFCQMKGLTAR